MDSMVTENGGHSWVNKTDRPSCAAATSGAYEPGGSDGIADPFLQHHDMDSNANHMNHSGYYNSRAINHYRNAQSMNCKC